MSIACPTSATNMKRAHWGVCGYLVILNDVQPLLTFSICTVHYECNFFSQVTKPYGCMLRLLHVELRVVTTVVGV